MHAELPDAVAAVVGRCERPTLIFDRARIEANLRAFAAAARGAGVTALFAAKAFPHPVVRALAAEILDGFDAASASELAELPAARIVSVADPTGRGGARAHAERLIVSCETVDQVRAAPTGAEIAIRLSASLTGRDPAVGAVLEGSGHRRSRFGLDVDRERRRAAIRALAAAARGRRVGLHVHHGPVAATTGERFAATARAALEAAADAELAPGFVNLGGAWHAVADLPGALLELRAAVPAAIEILTEPGRLFSDRAGYACGRVVAAREIDDRLLRVVDLSRICHLRWSHVELVAAAPAPGAGRSLLLVGPTCFEEDVIGEWTVDPRNVGDRIVVRNVSGYAIAWNAGFAGVPPADVVLV